MPEDSEAKKIYEGYSKDLENQANNLIQHGVNFDTRNGLLDLRGRYSGEIGMLEEAKKKLEEEQKLRRQEYGKDSTVMYGKDNLTIDDFIKGRNPNLFRVSGNELYASGVSLAKAFSSRNFTASDEGKILNGYYNDWKETTGMNQASLQDFLNNPGSQPYLNGAINDILAMRGTSNLSTENQARARQFLMRGIGDGMTYAESHKPVRNPGVLDPLQQLQQQKAQAEMDDYNFTQGQTTREYKDGDGNTVHYRYDPLRQGYTGTVYDKDYDFNKKWDSETNKGKHHDFSGTPTKDGIKWEGLDGAGKTTVTITTKKSNGNNSNNSNTSNQSTVEEQGYASMDPSKDYSN